MKQAKIKILTTFLVLCSILSAATCYGQEGSSDAFVEESLGDAALVAWSGLGGAILGISTLSFTENPKDHLKNIYVGASIGIIVGVALVAYMQANKARTRYDDAASGSAGLTPLFKFETNEFDDSNEISFKQASYGVGWTFQF
jgi:hypothetical protein